MFLMFGLLCYFAWFLWVLANERALDLLHLWTMKEATLKSREVRRIMVAGSAVTYAEPGYLLFRRTGKVMAQRGANGHAYTT